jgi:4'-phosphopantetheinyl transferase EntD
MNAALISRLFTRPVSVCIASRDNWGASLFAEEESAIANARPERRAEFAAGRSCARAALARLGAPPGPIVVGPDRAPVWPKDYVGSISHTVGFCCAVAARRSEAASVGLDVELAGDLSEGAASRVLRAEELQALEALPGHSLLAWAKAAFSAKEAFYKCYYPLAKTRLEFEDVLLRLAVDGRFEAELTARSKPLAGSSLLFDGRIRFADGRIYSGVTAPANRFLGF